MKTIVAATGNVHKLQELRAIFKEYTILSQREAGFYGDVEETGSTFAENALIKARAVSAALGCIALADDSGLCVDALDGAPGVYSARYCGRHGDDRANNELLLQNLAGKDRSAHFTSAIAIVLPDGREFVGEGITNGRILESPEGENGFGYDPLFYSEEIQKCFGLATSEEKNSVSHRYRALMAIRKKIEGIL